MGISRGVRATIFQPARFERLGVALPSASSAYFEYAYLSLSRKPEYLQTPVRILWRRLVTNLVRRSG